MSEGILNLSLLELCRLIEDHDLLRAASIVSSEVYREGASACPHRFIVLKLEWHERNIFWLRLDRRRDRKGPGAFRLVSAIGSTRANDTVSPTRSSARSVIK